MIMKTFPLNINRRLSFLLLMLIIATVAGAVETLQSPNGKYQFTFSQKDGKLMYSLNYANKPVVEEGELGVNIDNHLVELAMGIPVDNSGVWTKGMEVTSVERRSEDNTWKPVYGEYAQMRDHYNEMTIHLLKGGRFCIYVIQSPNPLYFPWWNRN